MTGRLLGPAVVLSSCVLIACWSWDPFGSAPPPGRRQAQDAGKRRPSRSWKPPPSARSHHPSHEHDHGDHPHEASDHHHHPHPHPHLPGPDGHHHPY